LSILEGGKEPRKKKRDFPLQQRGWEGKRGEREKGEAELDFRAGFTFPLSGGKKEKGKPMEEKRGKGIYRRQKRYLEGFNHGPGEKIKKKRQQKRKRNNWT